MELTGNFMSYLIAPLQNEVPRSLKHGFQRSGGTCCFQFYYTGDWRGWYIWNICT